MQSQSYNSQNMGNQNYYLPNGQVPASQAMPTQWSPGGAMDSAHGGSYYSGAPSSGIGYQMGMQQETSPFLSVSPSGDASQPSMTLSTPSFMQPQQYSSVSTGHQQTMLPAMPPRQGGGLGYAPVPEARAPSLPPPPPPAMNTTDENGLRWTWSTYPSAPVLLASQQSETATSATSAGSIASNNASVGGVNELLPISNSRVDNKSGHGSLGSSVAPLAGIKQSATDLLSKVAVKSHIKKNPFFPCPAEMVIPLSCMYEPLHPLPDPAAATTSYPPEGLQCNCCGAFCSIHSLYDNLTWVCLGCQTKFTLPRPLPEEHPLRKFSTVEYIIAPSPHLPPFSAPFPAHSGSPSPSYPGASHPPPGSWSAGAVSAAGPPTSVRDHCAIIFIVDLCISTEERVALQQHILEALQWLLPTTLVGFITSGSTTAVWELSNQLFRRCFVLRGGTTLNYHGFSKALQVKSTDSTRGRFLVPLQECRGRLEQLIHDLRGDPEVVLSSKRPTRTTGTAVSAATFLIEALSPLQMLGNAGSGAKGSAKLPKGSQSPHLDLTNPLPTLSPSAAVAETRVPARLLLFTGGPCTRGGGAVASPEKEQLMRFHRDILDGNTPFFESASKFYEDISRRLLYANACLDIFAQSFDQVGVMEMKSCVDNTGGYMICGDAFEHENFLHSMRRYALKVGLCSPETMIGVLSAIDQQQGNNSSECPEGDLAELEDWVWTNAGASGVGVEVEVICRSDDLVVSSVIGPCVPAAPSPARNPGSRATANKKGPPTLVNGNTGKSIESQRWFASSMHSDTALAIIFDVSPLASSASSPAYTRHGGGSQQRFVQFITRYCTVEGEKRLRVTTVLLPISPYGVSPQYFVQGCSFDETCAATIIARLAARAMEQNQAQWRQVRQALDNVLIDFVSRYATYTMGQPDSVQLPQGVSLFPVFLFNFRRSEYFMIINISPDEATFKRHWLMRETVDRCVLMIQPTLYSYTLDNPTALAVPLDSQSLHADNIVLMDAFFNMHIMWGSTIYEWIKQKYHENPEYEHFKNLLSAVEEDGRILLSQRFPYPRFSRTDANGSEARHIKNRVNPAHTYSRTEPLSDPYAAAAMAGVAGGRESADVINTDDTSIAKFTASLKRIVTGTPVVGTTTVRK